MRVLVTNLEDGPEDDHGFNLNGSGNICIEFFSNALFVWIVVQDRPVTIPEASMVFNTPPDLIRKAVDYRLDTKEGGHQRIIIVRDV
ncbi:MAG: hypothetical protein JKX94_09445 [Sneathiella sp.]|nr:hypothetical protein [Sneathiella sp.]